MSHKYVPIHVHSFDSTLDGLSSPVAIARRTVKIGATACALTDHAVVSGVPGFFKAMADACGTCGNPKVSHQDGKGKCKIRGETCPEYTKSKLKAIAGCEFNVPSQDASVKNAGNRSYAHLCVLAKNARGWKNLIGAVSESNKPTNFYYKPRLHLDKLAEFADKEWVVFSGHVGSTLANFIFVDYKLAYRAKTYDDAKSYVKNWDTLQKTLVAECLRYQSLFGEENFFLEIQLLDADNIPAAKVIANILRWVSKQTGIPCICTPDAHYATREDAPDQRILICSSLKTTLKKVADRAAAGEDVTLGGFFKSNNYHIPSQEEMRALHTDEEMANTLRIGDMIEPINLFGKSRIPKFDCPDGLAEAQYVRELCEAGWKALIEDEIPSEFHAQYRDRLNDELDVFDENPILHSYFLIVSDICRFSVEKLGSPLSEGRGSASGTLIGYLMRIHDSDPIEGDLSFARFFNSSRVVPDCVSFSESAFDKFNPAKGAASIRTTKSANKEGRLKNNKFYLEEMETWGSTRVHKYYASVIDGVEVDRANPNNSYIMWVHGKVDALDETLPCKIIQGKTSMPDIDLDFPSKHRAPVIQYMKDKYGDDKVSQIATFQELKGREALTQVLRAHDWGDHKERKELTKLIPQEAEISDKLQEMVEDTGESSIIRLALLNEPETFSQFCSLSEDGEFSGPMAPLFAQAIRLEGCKRGRGRHASGVIVSDVPLAEICPTVYDEDNDITLAGFAFPDLENLGLLKVDVLSQKTMDRMLGVYETLATGEIGGG